MIFKVFITASMVANAQANTHLSAMGKVEFNYVENQTLILSNGEQIAVTYHGYSAKEAQAVFKHILRSSNPAQKFLKQDGFGSTSCSQAHLNFYDVDTGTLHNKKLMTFIEWKKLSGSMIYAYFDSVDSPPGMASIFMTAPIKYDSRGLNPAARRKVIAHEMMHYWQDRTCNKKHDVEHQAERYAKSFGR